MDIKKQNKALKAASAAVFGNSARLEIVGPKKLSILKKNARYFKRDTYKQLVNNVKEDKILSSVPLCHVAEDGSYEVLSGNHRVKAAIDAGIENILVIILEKPLKKGRQVAIQLSHNALVGLDDKGILADLWQQVEDIEQKLYSGLNSDLVEELEQIKFVSLSTPNVATRTVAFIFTETEDAHFDDVVTELNTVASKKWVMAPLEVFDRFIERLQAVKKNKEVINGSMAILGMLNIVDEYLEKAAAEAPPEEVVT